MSQTTTYSRGLLAEKIAICLLMFKGYWLVAERYKTKVGEVDLILSRGNTIVFVEVKLRRSADEALASIYESQQQRIRRAAEMFLVKHKKYQSYSPRFDVVSVSPWKKTGFLSKVLIPRHLVNVF